MLSLRIMEADFFETILTAASCPVATCFASRTRPVAPLPNVLPSCQGPTRVFLRPFADVVDMAEFRSGLSW